MAAMSIRLPTFEVSTWRRASGSLTIALNAMAVATSTTSRGKKHLRRESEVSVRMIR
jgi:uncharacterized phosphosugar-binding protein